MKVLWLCSWYPNKLKPYDGDFIQRHARAVSLLHNIHAIHIVKNEDRIITKRLFEETTITGNLTETIIYYRSLKTGIRIFDQLLSANRYNQLLKKASKKYLFANRDCRIVHVHVAMKAGYVALWLKRKYSIPYIVSEHWTGFLSNAKPNVRDRSMQWKRVMRKVLANAEKITCVSKVLANAITEQVRDLKIDIIPNVVDTNIFYPVVKTSAEITTFIHISTMTYQKNIETMMEAVRILKKTDHHFILNLFVPEVDRIKTLVKRYELEDVIIVHGEIIQLKLVKYIQQSDALVLYSRYETFGCVVIEANACGVPAILSDLQVFQEYCVDGFNALIVPGNDATELSKAMRKMIEHGSNFDAATIARYTAEKFSYPVIANKFDEIYQSI